MSDTAARDDWLAMSDFVRRSRSNKLIQEVQAFIAFADAWQQYRETWER